MHCVFTRPPVLPVRPSGLAMRRAAAVRLPYQARASGRRYERTANPQRSAAERSEAEAHKTKKSVLFIFEFAFAGFFAIEKLIVF